MGKEAKQLPFIAPALIFACNHFDRDVDIVLEVGLVGNAVKSHGHFKFMLSRKNKADVKPEINDFEQGLVKGFIGCEVAAEGHGLQCVAYSNGVVINLFL